MAHRYFALIILGPIAVANGQVPWGDQDRCAANINLATMQPQHVEDRPLAWLGAHNHYRACHGVPPLQWNDALVPYARGWAEMIMQHCDGLEDLRAWAAGAGPGEQRPHDPNTYTEKPPMGENIYSGQGFANAEPEAQIVEEWYREVETQCPTRGLQPGCGGGELNHFTALIWKDATDVGCAAVARQTPNGLFVVADCRYASNKGNTLHHCQTPNTMSCDGPQVQDGNQVPALTNGACQKAQVVPQVPAGVGAPAFMAPGMGQVAQPQAAQQCIEKGTLGKCDKCFYNDQCGGGRYCCPFMKKCVKDGLEKCWSPIANCQPPCPETTDPKQCQCKQEDWPCLWQKPLCGKPLSCTPQEMERPIWDTEFSDGSTVHGRFGRVGTKLGPVWEKNVVPVEKRLDAMFGIERDSGATPWALTAASLFGSCLLCTVLRSCCCSCGSEQQGYYQHPYGPDPYSRPHY